MPRSKRTMPKPPEKMDAFEIAVAKALASHHDLAVLGASPLAAPYFLGDALAGEDVRARGTVLRALLIRHHAQLDPLQREVLDAYYLKRPTQPASPRSRGKKRVPQHSVHAIVLTKGQSKRSLDRHRNEAVRALAQSLLRELKPALRVTPPASREAIGRVPVSRACLAHLRKRECVNLIGPGGIGKTTLGADVAARWLQLYPRGDDAKPGGGVFWFTVRPGLNDQFESFAFALGYHLRLIGLPQVWGQLVADGGRAPTGSRYEVWKGLTKASLFLIQANPTLIVVDELEMLDRDVAGHRELLKALEDLRGAAPMLLGGQRAMIEADYTLTLKALDGASVAEMLAASGVRVGEDDARAITQITHGNPGLVAAFIALCRSGVRVADALQALEQSPTLDALFDRIWERLRDDERVMMSALSVLDVPAPRDGWPNLGAALDRLIEHMLVVADQFERVEVAQHLRRAARSHVDAETEIALHRMAADVFEVRGDYVTAMRHRVFGGQPDWALRIWHAKRLGEIEQGRGAAALNILLTIDPDALDERDQPLLHALRGQLFNLRGQPYAAEQSLRQAERRARMPLLALVKHWLGEALEAQRDRYENAASAYEEEAELLADLPELRRVVLHAELSNLYRSRMTDYRRAHEQALAAKVIADTFLGAVEQHIGNFREAARLYESALAAAAHLPGNTRAKSSVYGYAANLAALRGHYDDALAWLAKSRQIEQARGDSYRALYDDMTLSYIHVLRGAPQEALDVALPALEVAQTLGQGNLVGGLATNAAEALLALDRVDEAEQYARMALGPEETFGVAYGSIPLGIVYLRRGLMKQAIASFELALQAATESCDAYAEMQAWRELARAHLRTGSLTKAREAASHWLSLAQRMDMAHEIERAERLLQEATSE